MSIGVALIISCPLVVSIASTPVSFRDEEASKRSQRSLIRAHVPSQSLVVDHVGHSSGQFRPTSGIPSVLLMVLTYADSPRLPAALRTWIPSCAAAGFDIALYISEPQSQPKSLNVPAALSDRVHVFNTYEKLKKADSRGLERWKTWAFMREMGRLEFNHSFEPLAVGSHPPPFSNRRHDWFLQLDDDSLPRCEKIQEYVSLQKSSREAKYIGLRTGIWNNGCFMMLSRPAMGSLINQLGKEPLRDRSEADKCTPAYRDHFWESDCCVMEPMVYADVLIGSCLHRAGIQATSGDATFFELYEHGLKKAEDVESVYKKLYLQ
mmetsp:Transcript_49845/g.77874  ORF Transcript_49845/g.77874 Transcript_49845/m.77874 type:complete len:321 (-) Transcript_49845:28-990(-)